MKDIQRPQLQLLCLGVLVQLLQKSCQYEHSHWLVLRARFLLVQAISKSCFKGFGKCYPEEMTDLSAFLCMLTKQDDHKGRKKKCGLKIMHTAFLAFLRSSCKASVCFLYGEWVSGSVHSKQVSLRSSKSGSSNSHAETAGKIRKSHHHKKR